MKQSARTGAYVSFCLFLTLFSFVNQANAQTTDSRYFKTGNPNVVDIWLDPVNGNDSNTGSSRSSALKTLQAAWSRIPYKVVLSSTGYRINITPGVVPCGAGCSTWYAERYGTYENPIIIQAADGRGTATINAGLNIYDVSYLYLLDLNIVAGGGAGAFSNNVLHLDRVKFGLLRGLTIRGAVRNEFQEVLKVGRSTNIYVEDSDISGARSTVVDYVATQHGHIINNRIHDAGNWGMYLKGGSAHFQVEGNEIYDTFFGFSAGEGTGISYLEPPYLHYEAYDIKFINNVLHDMLGTGMAVAGGYNILLAYNTLYRTAHITESGRGSGLITMMLGNRVCDDWGGSCERQTDLGAWGPSEPLKEYLGGVIPNRNVYVYNNLFYNPAPDRTYYGHFVIWPGRIKPDVVKNLPATYLQTDQNLQIRGNVIWNGPTDFPLGIENPYWACQPSNPTCNPQQLRSDNTFNKVEPQFINPANRDFRLQPGSSVTKLGSYTIPDFTWDDAPTTPLAPVGNLSNKIVGDRENSPRAQTNLPGAYTTGCSANCSSSVEEVASSKPEESPSSKPVEVPSGKTEETASSTPEQPATTKTEKAAKRTLEREKRRAERQARKQNSSKTSTP
jgi:Right handed beta helix region